MKIFLQIILALMCVLFLLMTACGGFLVASGGHNDYGVITIAAPCFIIGAGLTWLMARLFKKVSRKQDPEKPA